MAIAQNTMIIDGQMILPGQEIPEFKSIKCVDTQEPRKYLGYSQDASVLNSVISKYTSDRASCLMIDTGEYYEYSKEAKEFVKATIIEERGELADKIYGVLSVRITKLDNQIAFVSTALIFKGSVTSPDLLPESPHIGDMYNIETKSIYGEAGMNVAWTGTQWDSMGPAIDTTAFLKTSDIAEWAKQPQKPTYTAKEVGALPASTKIPSKVSELANDSKFVTDSDLQKELKKKANGEGITLSINESGGLRITYDDGK